MPTTQLLHYQFFKFLRSFKKSKIGNIIPFYGNLKVTGLKNNSETIIAITKSTETHSTIKSKKQTTKTALK